jgi:hypothetical protein
LSNIHKMTGSWTSYYGQSCFVRSDFLKMKCVCKTQMMPPADHKKEMKSNYLSFCEYLTKITPPTGIPGENHRPATSHLQTLSHNVIWSTPSMSGFGTHNISYDRH